MKDTEWKIQIRSTAKMKGRISKGVKKKGLKTISAYVINAILAELIRDGVE